VQAPFSILERSLVERDLAEAVAPSNANLGLIAFSPLAGGALSGKYCTVGGVTDDDCRLTKFLGFQHRYLSQEGQRIVRRMDEVAGQFDLPLFALSLAWVYSRFFVTSTLLGAINRGNVLILLYLLKSQISTVLLSTVFLPLLK
jgi:aryl-alcohol dehydrogenase-like predicted oxidoreductase